LGGAEANLLDITNTYACMGRTLGAFYDRNGRYGKDDFRKPNFLLKKGQTPRSKERLESNGILSAGAIWHTFEAMREVERPNSTGEWELFRAGRPIAWKTGTSFGFRDAWAAGVTPRYAVGVWVGNADGEGRPGLIGVEFAAPVLFEIFEQLPNDGRWFDPPYDDMTQTAVCRQSGFLAGEYCDADTLWIPESGLKSIACQHHQLLHLDSTGQWQVTGECASPGSMKHQPWFVLPPIEEYYFKGKNPWYVSPPPFRADCVGSQAAQKQSPMQLIYPKQITRIYVPIDLNGKLSSTVFQAAHRNPDTEIYWHLDGTYLGLTKTFHQMSLQPPIGKHHLALVDKNGFRLEQEFEIIGKGK
jgi:penicillin-binding protein 1C